MSNATITITFNQDTVNGDEVCFSATDALDALPRQFQFLMRWVNYNPPLQDEVNISPPTETPGERSAIDLFKYFNLYYNQSGFWIVNIVANVVTITASVSTVSIFRSDPDCNVPSYVDIDVGFATPVDPFTIDSVEFLSHPERPCRQYKVRVTCSELASTILSPPQALPTLTGENTENPFEFDMIRGSSFELRVRNASGQLATRTFSTNQVPHPWNSSSVNVNIATSSSGNTVTVSSISVSNVNSQLTFEYSLDGNVYQSSNVFSNVEAGAYDLHVRDNLGCENTVSITIANTGVTKPYLYISESMPFRFCIREEFDNINSFQSIRNRLSHEEHARDKTLVYTWSHPWKNEDSQTIQFLSSYANNRAFVIKEDGSEDEVGVLKVTSLIGIKDKRDATKISTFDNKTGFYFTSGSTYNFDTNFTIGDYTLNGGLPEWAVIGNFILVGTSWHQITNVIYEESVESYVAVIDEAYTGLEADVIVGSIYNRQEFDVFEFSFIGLTYSNSKVRLKIVSEDPAFGSKTALSEWIDVAAEHPETYCIDYWNDNNTDVFFKGGLRLRARFPKLEELMGAEGENDVLKTDESASLQSADLYRTEEFNFDLVPKGIARMLSEVLTHKNVFVDGEGFAKNGDFEFLPQGKSNLLLTKLLMIRTGQPFTTQNVGAEVQIINDQEAIEIPQIITPGNDSFIGY